MPKRYKFEFFAQDFNSPLMRNYIFTSAFFKCPKLLKLPRFVIGIASKRNEIRYFFDVSTWAATHEAIKAKALRDRRYVDKLIDKFLKFGKRMNAWSRKRVYEKDLSNLSNRQLYKLLKGFIDRQSTMYAVGVMLPVLDFLDFSYVEGNLRNFLKDNVAGDEFAHYFNVFTYPLHESFSLLQEKDLLKLMAKYHGRPSWRTDVIKHDKTYLAEKYPEFISALKKHAAKHGWVYYVYMGPTFGSDEFLGFIRDYLKDGIKPEIRLQEMQDERQNIARLRKSYLRELKPDSFYRSILNLAPKMVWAKPTRKDLQTLTYFHVEKLYREIGRRLNLSLIQARSTPPEELKKCLLGGKTADVTMINQIYEFHVCVPLDNGTVRILYGRKAKDYLKTIKSEKVSINSQLRILNGTSAMSGRAKGKVKIINQPADIGKMEKGDILVSIATTPSIVPAMKMAAAIVTDEGGLTCHASIVSRELKIPCVVGTKIATSILKDGDKAEVDATKGIVKKVS